MSEYFPLRPGEETIIRFDRPAAAGPKVSVLVKTFNHASYIKAAIDSILEQSFQDFEIIVTDDASTDGTPDVVRGYSDPRIRLEELPVNQGISGAMNQTIARARGRYLAILNSDDMALPGRLRRQVDFLDAHPEISLVFGLARSVNEAGEPVGQRNNFALPLRFPDFSRRAWLRQFFLFGNCLCAPAAMIRREAYTAAGTYDRRLTNLQDLDMWVRMLLAGHHIHLLPEEVTAFRIRDGQANMSAQRLDTILRATFETGKILRHFAVLPGALAEEIFGDEIRTRGLPASDPTMFAAELALRDSRPVYQTFALDVLWETAGDTAAFNRLRTVAGEADSYGTKSIGVLSEQLIGVKKTFST